MYTDVRSPAVHNLMCQPYVLCHLQYEISRICNEETREIVNVPVMSPDEVQVSLGAVCMLVKKKCFFPQYRYFIGNFGGVHHALHQKLDGADSSSIRGATDQRRPENNFSVNLSHVTKQHLVINLKSVTHFVKMEKCIIEIVHVGFPCKCFS